jgi:hypothetical protein
MRTDRELLELAARAAGIAHEGYGEQSDMWPPFFLRLPTEPDYWNPLLDDGDCFRLMVQLGIDVGFGTDGTAKVICAIVDSEPYYGIDAPAIAAAARRAIVELAANDVA